VKQKKYKESNYPVYWLEVFDEAYQKWLAVDPLVTRTIDKPQKLEPPASDSMNDMTYVIAFNEDGSAKDVTRRYAKAYNAKTRRSRIEVTKDGKRWWKRAFRIYKGIKEVRKPCKGTSFR
jgi:xeroderma pigmentosum group C-complementing protein